MKRTIKIWLSFAIRAILIQLIFFFISGLVSFRLFYHDLPPQESPSFWYPVMVILIIGFLLSSILTTWVSKRLFRPVEILSHAMNQVAAGNFQIQLTETPEDTQICQMNCNFNKMVRELSSTQLLHSDFIRNVSHEIKTPLAAIEGYAALLEHADLPEDLHGYAVKIEESSRQLSVLTGNILRLSRLERQEIVSSKEVFSLDEQIRQALLSLEPLWTKKELDIDLDLAPIHYCADPDLLYQVWINLFSNAIKFTPPGGLISANMVMKKDWIFIQIRDTGIGMDAQTQKHIFEKFYQGDSSRHIEGNGLGLALVKQILDLCKGRIEVQSEPNKGSSFSVSLPL